MRWRWGWSLLGSSGRVKFSRGKIILIACLLAASFTQFLTLRAFTFVREQHEHEETKKILDVDNSSPWLSRRPPASSSSSEKRRRVVGGGEGGVNVISGTADDGGNGEAKAKVRARASDGNFAGVAVAVAVGEVEVEVPVRVPCVVGGGAPKNGRGLFYIKTPKCASSTLAGIARRMAIRNHPANNVNNNNNGTTTVPTTDIRRTCKVHSRHRPAYKIPGLDHRRDADADGNGDSFLFAFVRDPTERFVSDFYHFQVSRNGVEPTDEALLSYVNGGFARNHRCCGHFAEGMGGFQFPYLLLPPPPRPSSTTTAASSSSRRPVAPHTFWHPDRPDEVRNLTHLVSSVESILQSYDFIGTVERLDESLVAMSFLLFGRLRADHILYLPSKVSGGYDDGRFRNTCIYIQQPPPGLLLSPSGRVGSYLASAEWSARVAGDALLHDAADASLDATIDDVIGRDAFDEALGRFRTVLRTAADRCTNETVRFPCRWDGTRNEVTDCYDGDEGCGHECLDRVYESFAATATATATAPSG